jgi:ribonucleoside-triphosphate reductase
MRVIKRDGSEKEFSPQKIKVAVEKANKETGELSEGAVVAVVNDVLTKCRKLNRALNVEEIQDLVENALMKNKAYVTAKCYVKYRYQKELDRKQNTTDSQILTTVNLENEEVKQENSNKNPTIIPTQRDYIAGLISKDLTNRYLLPADIVEAHKLGILHFHDADYFLTKEHNCDVWNLEDMLQNGTVINGVKIDTPKSFITACTITTQIMAIVASCQYGGQTITLSHLAPFVNVSREKIRKEVVEELKDLNVDDSTINKITESRLKKEIKDGVQTIQYQILTLNSTNGQTPFVSLSIYLNEAKSEQEKEDLALIVEEVLKQRIQGIKNEKGVWVTPAFPKLLYILEEDNVYEDSKYFYLTKLAAKCTAKRMVPDYISEKIMLEYKINEYGDGDCYPCMGCRSFLTPDRSISLGNVANALNYVEGKPKYYGRFNQGVVTINLVDVACSSKGNIDKFWKILDERLDMCHRALRIRHERLLGTPSDVAPILWQHGALARLEKGEKIDKLLYNGYSTISLGYAGLWEMVYYMTGKKITEEEGKAFGLEVMQKLNEYTAMWKAAENIDYSLYGTPIESTTYKFAKCLQERFGIIKGVTDKNYITNSYHVHVTEDIDAFSKLALESEFQRLSPGGAISYVEVPDMQSNIEAVISIIQFIYENIMYAELNTKSDYCQCCGFDGEIQVITDSDGKYIWECPNCRNRDQNKMNVARRTCGYIGSQFWNQGRTEEIKERVLHL